MSEERYRTEGFFGSEFSVAGGKVRRVSDYQMFPAYKGSPVASEYYFPAEPTLLQKGCTVGCLAISIVGIPYLGYLAARKAYENRPVMPWEARAVMQQATRYSRVD